MKKLIVVFLAVMLIFVLAACADEADEVYVTIVNGDIVLAYEDVDLTDIDKDGALTINDALYLAHAEKYSGGAAAGYASESGEYGLSLGRLWGIENGGGYGYAVNSIGAMSLADPIKAGDHIVAYVYTDLTAWSDVYSFFDKTELEVKSGAEFTLVLSMNSYDAEWNPVVLPVSGATITVDGVATDYVTDADGKVTVSLADDAIVSAVSDTLTLVAPICVVDVD